MIEAIAGHEGQIVDLSAEELSLHEVFKGEADVVFLNGTGGTYLFWCRGYVKPTWLT